MLMATAPSPNDLTRQQLDELDALLQRMLSVPIPSDAVPAAGGGREAPAGPAARGGIESADALTDPPLPPSWRVDPPAGSRTPGAPAGGYGAGPREGSAPAPHLVFPEPPSSVSLALEPPAPAALAQTPAPTAPLKPSARPAAPPAPRAAPAAPPAAAPQPAQTVTAPPILKPVPVVVSPPAPPAPKPAPQAPTSRLTPAPTAPPVPFLFLPFVGLNALFDAGCGVLGPFGRVLRSGFFKQLCGLAGLGLLIYTAAHVAHTQKWITLPIPLPWPPGR
jgi:hypothetical protein